MLTGSPQTRRYAVYGLAPVKAGHWQGSGVRPLWYVGAAGELHGADVVPGFRLRLREPLEEMEADEGSACQG